VLPSSKPQVNIIVEKLDLGLREISLIPKVSLKNS